MHTRIRGVVTWDVIVGVIVGRIATIVVMMGIGVVMRIHRRHVVRVMTRTTRRRRRHHRTIAVVVVAVAARTSVVARTRSDMDDHPRLVVITVPAEAERLKVFESGETIELIVQLVIWHHCIEHRRVRTIGRDGDCNPSDTAGTDFHVL